MTNFVLGIETSCDETAAAVVCNYGVGLERIRSSVIRTQLEEHIEYGGVVPEIAARAHAELLFPIIQKALKRARLSLFDIDAISATCGPGLMGGIMVGALAAKALAMIHHKPFIAINHLEGHAHVCRLSEEIDFPYLLLLVSGGHCQFLEVYGLNRYKLLGETIDDSAGEAFDKVARLLGLSYPGGPLIEKYAHDGDPYRFSTPIPLKGKPGCNLSFSGLKTAFRLLIQRISPLSEQDIKDISACLQKSIADTLVDRARHALGMVSEGVRKNKTFVVAGGVAANKTIQKRLEDLGHDFDFRVITPPINLCTDNAVMIAWAGLCYHLQNISHDFSFTPQPRWKLEDYA